jgi:lysozyme family protein
MSYEKSESLVRRKLKKLFNIKPTKQANEPFEAAFRYMLANEVGPHALTGGFTNDTRDAGGATRWGISQRFLSRYLGREVEASEIENLNLEEAKAVYRDEFWEATRIGEIDISPIRVALFDFAVLFGPAAAIKNAQLALRFIGRDLKVDGVLGSLTLREISTAPVMTFLLNYRTAMKAHAYQVSLNPVTNAGYLRGWENRIERILRLS